MTDEKKAFVTMDVVALERLIPRHAYVGDLTLTENLHNYIEWLKAEVDHWKGASKEHAEAQAAAVEAFHDATRLRSQIQQARINAENERDEALARCETLRGLADTTAAEQGLAQRRMLEAQKRHDELRAEVERLRAALRTVAERQREADKAACFRSKFSITGGPDSRAGAFNAGCDAAAQKVGATPLVTEEKP